MAFGDYLRRNIYLLKNASRKKVGPDAFWEILRSIAVQDILSIYPAKIDSDTAIPIYYQILDENKDKIPPLFFRKIEFQSSRKI